MQFKNYKNKANIFNVLKFLVTTWLESIKKKDKKKEYC